MRGLVVTATAVLIAGLAQGQGRDPVVQVFKAQVELEKKLVLANLAYNFDRLIFHERARAMG